MTQYKVKATEDELKQIYSRVHFRIEMNINYYDDLMIRLTLMREDDGYLYIQDHKCRTWCYKYETLLNLVKSVITDDARFEVLPEEAVDA